MARAPKDEFGTPFGQAGSAAATKLGTPFGQAGSKAATTATVTIGGAPAGYAPLNAPNYRTGTNLPTPPPPPVPKLQDTPPPPPPKDTPKDTGYTTGPNGELLFNGRPFNGNYNGLNFINGWRQDLYDEFGNDRTKVKPGPTGLELGSTRTLAKDTFKNTLALFFGAQEMSKGWADALYGSVSGFYNTGSTIDEALNLSLQDVRSNPALKPFTDRFKGIYALQDRLAKGEAIEVPTIAEFFKSESAMGDVLRQAGMGELASQEFLGNVLGLGKSVLEVTNLINDTFYSIDNAPAALKTDLQSIMQLGVSRTDIAKALLTGAEGAAALNKKIAGVSTFSAAKSQGVAVDMGTAADIAARGFDYGESLTGFGTVKRLERGKTLAQFSGGDLTQQEAIASTFENNVQAQEKIMRIGEQEGARFAGRSGRLASQSRAQGMF
jgi:hypothetical protein